MDNSTPQVVTLNMEAIRQSARLRYIAARKRKRTLRDWIEAAIPAGLLIIVIAAILLSAPHTVAMFNIITPGLGIAGVFLIEFGLMYLAFRRRQQGKLPGVLRAFEVLVFAAAVIVNGAGALMAAVSMTGIQSMSANTIYSQFGTLPINSQVGLMLAGLAAVLIPITTIVSGEGFANFVLEDKQADRELDEQWQQAEQIEVYQEAYSYLLHRGVNPRDAQRRAGSATTNFYQAGLTIEIPSESVSVEVSAPATRTISRTKQRSLPKPSANKGRKDVRLAVREYLDQNPDAVNLSVRDLGAATGASKTVAGEELSAYKASSNGHGKV